MTTDQGIRLQTQATRLLNFCTSLFLFLELSDLDKSRSYHVVLSRQIYIYIDLTTCFCVCFQPANEAGQGHSGRFEALEVVVFLFLISVAMASLNSTSKKSHIPKAIKSEGETVYTNRRDVRKVCFLFLQLHLDFRSQQLLLIHVSCFCAKSHLDLWSKHLAVRRFV